MLVEGKQSVKGKRARTQKMCAERNVWIYGSTSADTDDGELTQLGTVHSGLGVNIHRRV